MFVCESLSDRIRGQTDKIDYFISFPIFGNQADMDYISYRYVPIIVLLYIYRKHITDKLLQIHSRLISIVPADLVNPTYA